MCCPNAMSASSFASNFSSFFIIFRLFCHRDRSKNLPRSRRQRRSGGLSHSTCLAVHVHTTCFERMINDRTHLTSDRRQQQQPECTYRARRSRGEIFIRKKARRTSERVSSDYALDFNTHPSISISACTRYKLQCIYT
uniref:Secreted protein n=1 Tax=Trichogramma kaykai TaxID=54128 RepID=A0ABD2VW08_9HYME